MSNKLEIEQVLKTADRFWSKVKRGRPGECWEFQASINRQGYGQFGIGKRPYGSHRVAWMLHNRQLIPRNMFVCHSCDNKVCCNPSHLFVGTHEDNMSDLVKKGHARGQDHRSGESHWRSVLTEAQVIEIRKRHATTELAANIASEFGVTVPTVCSIVTGKTWQLADGPIVGVDYVRHRRGFGRQDISIEWLY